VRLPGASRAVVDEAKVRDYLLSWSHPVGRSKAAFFGALGYSARDHQRLAADLLEHALAHDVRPGGENEYGRKYEVRGRIEVPAGKAAVIVSVWIVLYTEDFPRFVTAYPE